MEVEAPLVPALVVALARLAGNVLSIPAEEFGIHLDLAVQVATLSLPAARTLSAEIKAGARGRLEVPQQGEIVPVVDDCKLVLQVSYGRLVSDREERRLACDRQGLLRRRQGYGHRGRVPRIKRRHPPLDAQDGEAMVDRRITFVVTLVHEGRQEDGRSVVREERERNHG